MSFGFWGCFGVSGIFGVACGLCFRICGVGGLALVLIWVWVFGWFDEFSLYCLYTEFVAACCLGFGFSWLWVCELSDSR